MNTATLLLRRSGGAAARCYASASASISTGRVAMVQGASRGALVVVFFTHFQSPPSIDLPGETFFYFPFFLLSLKTFSQLRPTHPNNNDNDNNNK